MNAVGALWWRDVLRTVRNRAVMISALTIPSVFLAAFYAMFALPAQGLGLDYATFLLPTGLLQAAIFTAGGSALALARDAEGGVHERIRAMPLATGSIAAGRILADLTRFAWSGGIVALTALALGARPAGGWALGAFIALMLVLTASLCAAVDAATLLSSRPVSTAMLFQGLTVLALMFSTAFVPAPALTGAAGNLAKHMPFSPILDTARDLAGGVELHRGVEGVIWLIIFAAFGAFGLMRALRRHHD